MTAQTGAEGESEGETLLAELGLSRELTLQWTVVSTLGFLIALGAFGALYGVLTGRKGRSRSGRRTSAGGTSRSNCWCSWCS